MSDSPTGPTPRARARRPGCVGLALAIWLGALAVSHVVRRATPPPPPPPQVRAVELHAVRGDELLPDLVRVTFDERDPPGEPDGLPLLLLHGSPGSREDFAAVLPSLDPRRRVVAPDLPGFGDAEKDVPDYSVRAHARYALQLLDELGIERAHVVGFSMGGGVGLNLYDIAPQRVASLTLLSAIGVQEMELFGSYRLNHMVHAAQLSGLWLLREAVPHMGLLDDTFFGVPYARNFYDTDQRPLRGILERFAPPMLIIHGEQDFLVPPEAACEHRRIVPQSELQMLPAGHFMAFAQGTEVARRIDDFVARVERGEAPGRADAGAARTRAAAAPFDPGSLPEFTGVALLLALAMIALATLVSEDLTCVGVGLLVAQGRIGFVAGTLACFVGIYVGDLLLYAAGRFLGRPALERAPLRWWMRPEHVQVSSAWFNRRGPVVIVLSRFIPGTRLPTFFAAGMLRTGFWSFCGYFFLAVAVWTPLLVAFSAKVGERAFLYFEAFQRQALPALLLLGLWVVLLTRVVVPLFSRRGRRRLVGRWRRLRDWEFWPPWLFYAPVVAYVLWLGIRHRAPLLFTAANPAIPAGGFIHESKQQILDGLAGSAELVAASRRIPCRGEPRERVEQVLEFLAERGLDYPVVLKPDTGQRGSGVAIVRDRAAVEAYMDRSRFDVVAQEYADGAEFGIFYVRHPDRPRGRIFSITEKRFPELVGDGRHTLEELILLDERAVAMADYYSRVNVARIEEIPKAGEAVRLVELGTHCRGAVFLDGSWLFSEELEAAIDAVSRGYPGFYFGRYDLRAPDVDELRRGRGFKIVELNGVTSEATHIYDPSIRLTRAWATLFEQWRIAFEIGAANRRRGARPAGLRDIMRMARDYRRAARTHPD